MPSTHRLLSPLACALLVLATSAQSRKVNGPLARAFAGEVREVSVSPDGAWAVFFANPDSERFALFGVPLGGGAPLKLAGDVHPNSTEVEFTRDGRSIVYASGDLYRVALDDGRKTEDLAEGATRPELTPDGTRVVYLSADRLHVLPLDGSTDPLPLSQPLGSGYLDFQVAADGRSVVYLVRESTGIALHAAALDGSGAPVALSASLGPDDDVRSFAISADGTRAVFLAYPGRGQPQQLYVVPVDGSAAAVRLNGTLPPQGAVADFRLSADCARAVYRADEVQDELMELLSVPLDGSAAPIRLNAALPAFGDVGAFELTPDGTRVLYLADQERDGAFQLFVVDIDGSSGPTRLDQAAAGVSSFRIGPDGERFVFQSSGLFGGSLQRPGEVVRLWGGVDTYQFTPDGTRVVYRADGLFSVPSDGSAGAVRLDDGGEVRYEIVIAADGTVLFRSDRDVEGVFELRAVPADGSRAPWPLGPELDSPQVSGDVTSSSFGPDGRWAVFTVETQGCCDGSHDELFSVRLEPRSRPILLFPGGRILNDDDLHGVSITPDGSRVVFAAGSDEGESTIFLYSLPIDGRGERVRLNDPAGLEYGLYRFLLSSDGSTVFYSQDGLYAGVYRVPSDGSAPPSLLLGSSSASGGPPWFDLAPGDRRVVFLSDPSAPGESELRSVLADGSAPAVVLDGHGSYPFQVTPDGQRVVYVGGPAASVIELFSAAIDGSTGPVRLSGTLGPDADVDRRGFELTANGRFVVYLADAVVDGVSELFSAPVDGSAPPVRLTDAHRPVGYGSGPAFRLAANGGRVVYRVEPGSLLGVPVDGSSAPIRLDSARGSVTSFELAPDGARAVYRADPAQDGVFELLSVPLDAGSPPLQLTGPHVAGSVLEPFRITPDGREVVFGADHDVEETYELHAAPIDRSKGTRKLNGPLVDGGDVLVGSRGYDYGRSPVFQLGPDSRRVLYVADQDRAGVHELYLTALDGGGADGGGRTGRRPQAPRIEDE